MNLHSCLLPSLFGFIAQIRPFGGVSHSVQAHVAERRKNGKAYFARLRSQVCFPARASLPETKGKARSDVLKDVHNPWVLEPCARTPLLRELPSLSDQRAECFRRALPTKASLNFRKFKQLSRQTKRKRSPGRAGIQIVIMTMWKDVLKMTQNHASGRDLHGIDHLQRCKTNHASAIHNCISALGVQKMLAIHFCAQFAIDRCLLSIG